MVAGVEHCLWRERERAGTEKSTKWNTVKAKNMEQRIVEEDQYIEQCAAVTLLTTELLTCWYATMMNRWCSGHSTASSV